MKLLDKILKKIKTDRNTFFTYILLLISIYILVDRVFEFLLILFTGVAYNYWGPVKYAIAMLPIIFCFLFSLSSKYITCDDDKLWWFRAYCISLYILSIIMVTEFLNKMAWIIILSLPNYKIIITQFAYLIKPAISAITIYLPFVTAPMLFNKISSSALSQDMIDSIFDYDGIGLSDKSKGWGQYTDEIFIGIDKDHGNKVKIPELRRFESTLICGVSGAGKTSLIFEPWVAQDISKKYFYKESSKTLAFSALKAGIATIDAPYDNEYINKNFNLNMIKPVESKIGIFKSYFKDLIYADTGNKLVFRNSGITYISPDFETISKVSKVCDNYGMAYNIVDPTNPNSLGLNPFSFNDPVQTAIAISTALKGLETTNNALEIYQLYENKMNIQIVENIAILLKVCYPMVNEGKIANIEDMVKLLNDFSLIEKMSKLLENDKELATKYSSQITYFQKNFYKNSPNKSLVQKSVPIIIAQIATLLRYPGVRNILCNRNRNINYDNALENGEITLFCTRRGELGENAHKAFGLFFLLLMQYSVLRRPGNEATRIPHYLYIDEFPDFICNATESIFTVYRKYRIATVVSVQNLSQLKSHGEKLGETIIANCANKIVFGNNSPEDNIWWGQELGDKKDWSFKQTGYHTKDDKYDEKINAEYVVKQKYQAGKIQALKFKRCMYKVKDLAGKIVNGTVSVDFIPSKYLTKQQVKFFDFEKFTNGISEEGANGINGNRKLKLTFNGVDHFKDNSQNPIISDDENEFDINNENAITFTFKKGKKE